MRSSLSALRCENQIIPLRSAVPGRSSPLYGAGRCSLLCGAGAILSALRCRGDPLRSAMPGQYHPSPLCGAGVIPSLSARRCRGDPLSSVMPGQDHQTPLCGAGTRSSLSALRCHDQIIPLRSAVWGDPIPLHSAVPGQDHPSPLCGAGAIISALWCRGDPLRSAVRGDPLRSAVPERGHPSPLCGVRTRSSHSALRCGAIPSLSTRRCRDKTIPLHSAVPGRSSQLCGVGAILSALRCGAILSALRCRNEVIPLRSAVSGPDHPTPLSGAGRSHPSPLGGAGTRPSLFILRCRRDPLSSAVPGRSSQLCGAGAILSALWCRGDPLRSAVPERGHPTPLGGAGTRPSLSTLRCGGDPLSSVVPG